jgi:hypothetical protein
MAQLLAPQVVQAVLVVVVVTVVQAVLEHLGKVILEALALQAINKVLVAVVALGLLE